MGCKMLVPHSTHRTLEFKCNQVSTSSEKATGVHLVAPAKGTILHPVEIRFFIGQNRAHFQGMPPKIQKVKGKPKCITFEHSVCLLCSVSQLCSATRFPVVMPILHWNWLVLPHHECCLCRHCEMSCRGLIANLPTIINIQEDPKKMF
jgi:hypothetical protein